MKSLFSSRRFALIIFLAIAVMLAACVRQIDPGADATTAPATLTLPEVQPTVDPLLAPTVDPSLAPTTDPLLAPTVDPALAPTADPGTNVVATPSTTSQTTHVVGAGETLFSIAVQYGLTVEALAGANNLDPNGVLSAGQTLIIPVASPVAQPTVAAQPTTTAGEQVHIVAAGENLFRIGLRYGFTVAELAAYNNIPNPNYISVGQVILIPPGGNP